MKRTRFVVAIVKLGPHVKPVLQISFRGPRLGRSSRLNKSRNIFARALVNTMLENARLVAGLSTCSASLSTISGICNNPFHPTYGIQNALQRHPWNTPTLSISTKLPNPREISNFLCRARSRIDAPMKINFLMVIFGQFLDHDIVLTPSGDTSAREASISMPASDPGTGKMHFMRSDSRPMTPHTCCDAAYDPSKGERRQFNKITSFIDMSTIYGSDNERAASLRLFKHGKLITLQHNGEEILPRNSRDFIHFAVENANQNSNVKLFASGDVRANENPFLTAMHTLFVREHNRVCDLLINAVPRRQSDEWIYQQARRIVIGEMQNIVYHEFIPAMLGDKALDPYTGYRANVDASIDIMFSTAAYRWGHSAIRNVVETRGLDGKKKTHLLQEIFFNPDAFFKYDVEHWVLGAMGLSASGIDLEHADAIRDFLFHPRRKAVLDLVALNIQRGRDHGLPSYTTARQVYGLSNGGQGLKAIPSRLRTRLLRVYGSAKNIDPFIGGLAEKPLRGSLLGPLFHKIVAKQFTKLRDGDRFYYENVQWGRFLSRLKIVRRVRTHKVRLADIIKWNTKITDKHIPSGRGAMRTR